MSNYIFYLAAGNSRRFGTNKLLYDYRGKPLYRHGLDMLHALCRRRPDCFLTVISRYPEILKWAKEEGIRAVNSPDSEKGMSYTIKAAIHSLPDLGERDYLMFVVADQPYLTEHTVEMMLDLAVSGVETVSASYEGIPGNPVLFSARLAPELLALQGDEGGRRVIRGHSCIYVSAEDGRELYDIDTPPKQADFFSKKEQ